MCQDSVTPKSAKGMCPKHYRRYLSGKDPNQNTDYDKRECVILDDRALLPIGRDARHGWAVIDKDMIALCDYKWHIKKADGYVARTEKYGSTTKMVRLHHAILGNPPIGQVVDHINGNRHDNRKSNLRFVTRQQNNYNHAVYKNNTAGYIGAYLHKPTNRWMSKIGHNGKLIHLGTFATAEEAARARDKAAIELHGIYAKLNVY